MIETVAGLTDLQIRAITALAQLALAAAVAYVAWQQWRTARNKLKSDLFERRFKLVNSLRRCVQKVQIDRASATELLTLNEAAREAGFLFNKCVRDISNRLTTTLLEYNTLQDILKQHHGYRMIQENKLSNPEAHGPEEIQRIEKANTETISTLKEVTKQIKTKRTEISKEIKLLEEKTSQFLTLRH